MIVICFWEDCMEDARILIPSHSDRVLSFVSNNNISLWSKTMYSTPQTDSMGLLRREG